MPHYQAKVLTLLSLRCPQEPPEDDANIIEKILASRLVQKEVSVPPLLCLKMGDTWAQLWHTDMALWLPMASSPGAEAM